MDELVKRLEAWRHENQGYVTLIQSFDLLDIIKLAKKEKKKLED